MNRLRRAVAFVVRTVTLFMEAGGLEHAAAIAFFGLLSLVPFILLAMTVLATIATAAPDAFGSKPVLQQVLEPLREVLPFLAGEAERVIVDLARARGTSSLVGAFALLLSAMGVFNAIAGGINAVLGTRRRRTVLLTRLVLAALVVSLAGALLLWQIAWSVVLRLVILVGRGLPAWLPIARVAEWGLGTAALAAGFYLLVRVMATDRSPRRDRLIGAVVFAALFEAARVGLQAWLTYAVSLSATYGAASALVGLILWLYTASIVLLVSCAVVRVLGEVRAAEPAT